ncbi:MAG: FYVE zinc finger domain-containing protein [archaeon]|nr:FYVE zinc finger domain-containing protein [archaeon]
MSSSPQQHVSVPLSPPVYFSCFHDDVPKRTLMCEHEFCMPCLVRHLESNADRPDLQCPEPECGAWMTKLDIKSIERVSALSPLRSSSSPSPLSAASTPLSLRPPESPAIRQITIIPQLIDPGHPHWVTDDSSDVCYKCKEEFSLINRRHHCRFCGQLFCGNCCPSDFLGFFDENPKPRRCVDCVDVKVFDQTKGYIRHEL